MAFDPQSDFAPITLAPAPQRDGGERRKAKAAGINNNVADFIQCGQYNPGKFNMAAQWQRHPIHMAGELFRHPERHLRT
jgi:hypothetical protein